MDQRISCITLGVADLERARRFYESGLGWQSHGQQDGVVFFQLTNGLIVSLFGRKDLGEDMQRPPAPAGVFSGLSIAYNVRTEADVDAVLAQAAAAGGELIKQAHKTPWGGYSGYFADPDGHVWEVAHNPFWTIGADGKMTLPPVK